MDLHLRRRARVLRRPRFMIKTTTKELLDLENQYWTAIKEKDADLAMRLTDEECIVTGAQGVGRINRQVLSKMLKDAPYTLHHFELKDAEVRQLRDDVAILGLQGSRGADGRRQTGEARRSRRLDVGTPRREVALCPAHGGNYRRSVWAGSAGLAPARAAGLTGAELVSRLLRLPDCFVNGSCVRNTFECRRNVLAAARPTTRRNPRVGRTRAERDRAGTVRSFGKRDVGQSLEVQ